MAAAALASPRGIAAVLARTPSDVVVLSALRTPVCRAHKGLLRAAYPEELLAATLAATRRRLLDDDDHDAAALAAIDDVAVGVVLSELGGSKAARVALAHVGFDPAATALHTVNRACASSLQAVAAVAAQIRLGDARVAVAAGMESMTRNYASRALPLHLWPALARSPVKAARDCIMPMGLTSEMVAARYTVSRADQDAFALVSHQRAAAARDAGRFADETVPVTTTIPSDDDNDHPERHVVVEHDDGIRPDVSLAALARLKPAFAPDGASTAGNSSQVSDGAAALVLAGRATAAALGLEHRILGRFVSSVVAGCAPDEMGVGPAVAVPRLLARHGLAVGDIHRWEINEAFASQALYCLRALGLESAWERGLVNPDGGAIALGHPLGATGARMTSTLIHGLRRADAGELGVVTMCVGTGMGMAALFVRE